MSEDLVLAGAISSCPEVERALLSKSHPCRSVVFEQNRIISTELDRQRPEPWVGTLSKARLMFLSSNPSISEDPGEEREDFPTYRWQPEDSGLFFVERFNQEHSPVHATFNFKGEPNFLTRSRDGKYRSGTMDPKRPQDTWRGTHDRAKELLGADCHPHTDYAITEIVHCKSKQAEGVKKASQHCVDTWLSQILALSPAPVIIALGSKVRDNFAIQVLGFDSTYGHRKGYKLLTQKERALRDIKWSDFGGSIRLVVFNFHPTSGEKRILKEVYGPKLIHWLSQIIEGLEPVPASRAELKTVIENLFG